MSLNGLKGQQGRPVARPSADQTRGAQTQPNWPSAQDFQQAPHWPQPNGLQGFPPQQRPAPSLAQDYQQPAPAAPYSGHGLSADAYAPNFQPYNPSAHFRGGHGGQPVDQGLQPPQQTAHYPPTGYGAPDAAHQWAQPQGLPGHHGQPAGHLPGGYHSAEPHHQQMEPHFSDWQQGYAGQAPQGYDYGDGHGYQVQDQQRDHYGDMGFAQAHGGELDQAYAEEDDEDYEYEEETSSGRSPLRIVAALAGAIFVGGSMAYGYKALFGGGPSGTPPVVKSASAPTKTKPADAGGAQFAHTDSKIMGRLGDGSGTADSNDLDANGARKVATLVVGRDGSIQAPPAEPASEEPSSSSETVSVPGLMVVDGLGTRNSRDSSADAPAAPQKVVVTPPAESEKKQASPAKMQVLNDPDVGSSATGSIEDDAPAPAKPAAPARTSAPQKVAALAPASTDAAPSAVGGDGFVAVLASVPKSQTSRMDALKRFADLQQKYGSVLVGKTPDVAEANLGAKGAYHRLIVGPPASRQQASAVCVQLKANGYSDCWVTTY